MRSNRALLTLAGAALVVASACTTAGASTGPSSGAVSSLTATSVPEATQAAPTDTAAASSGGSGSSAPPSAIDPCSLLTQDEATTAVGTKVGPGSPSLVGQSRVCTWKTGTTEVKVILAPPAADAASAQAYWDAAQADIPEGITIDTIGGFDRAAYGTGGQAGFSVSALFVIKGAQFFDFYCGLKACTEVASVVAANAIVARLP
ncbi:MAG TPA: hypothetical protein VF484_10570 [Candidatus Limnocylindrales bacterium]